MVPDRVSGIVEQWRQQRPDLDPSPLEIIGRIQQVAELMDAFLRPPFAGAGLGDGDFDVLAALRRAGPPFELTPGQLSERMLVTTGAVTKRVDRLLARGLVTREIADDDARGRRVRLTADGRRLVDRLMTEHLRNEARLLARFTPEERDTFRRLLMALTEAVEDDQDR